MPVPSKALECRGDIKTMLRSREDSQQCYLFGREADEKWDEAAVEVD